MKNEGLELVSGRPAPQTTRRSGLKDSLAGKTQSEGEFRKSWPKEPKK